MNAHETELANLRADAAADRIELLAGKARLTAEVDRLRRQLAERERDVADRDRALRLLLDVTAQVAQTARVALGEGVTRVQDAPVRGDPAPAEGAEPPVLAPSATKTDPSRSVLDSVPAGALRVVTLPRAGSGEARDLGARLPAQQDGG